MRPNFYLLEEDMTSIELRAAEATAILPKYLKGIEDAIRELNETLKVLYVQIRQDRENSIKGNANDPEKDRVG